MPALANAKHEAVAIAYIADPARIGWRAYRKAYPKSSQHAAETRFGRLLKNVEFSARVAELAEAAAQGTVMAAREVLVELPRIGRANMLDYMRIGPDGDPVLDWSRLRRDQAAALIEVTVEDFLDGRGENTRAVRRIKFKLAGKIDALELLGKHHKLYIDRVEHEYGGAGLAERLAAAIARVRGETSQEQRRSSPTERRQRSQVGTRTGRRRQNITRKVQKVVRPTTG